MRLARVGRGGFHAEGPFHPYRRLFQRAHAKPGGSPGRDRPGPGRRPLLPEDGSFSEKPGTGREVTLLEIEAIDALKLELGLEIEPGEARRNLVTRGVALNHLVGREFTVGEARLLGCRLCEPCSGLAAHTGKSAILPGLIHRGGLRCDILEGGVIRVGDAVVAL